MMEGKKKKRCMAAIFKPTVVVSASACNSGHMCVCEAAVSRAETINGGVTTKQEAGMAQGDRLLGPSLAAAKS